MTVDAESIPEPVRRYAERVLSQSQPEPSTVRIEQSGQMILKPGASPRRFTATEEFAVDRVAFAWRARFPILGSLAVRVTDSYDGGQGSLEMRALGIPLQRKRGHDLARGQALRYLAEIAWVPHAILGNPQLEWQERDQHTVEVSTSADGHRVAVQLRFNQAGEITQTVADRPRLESDNQITRWVGEFTDYRELGGVLVPARGEVRWELPEGPFTYWRGTLSSLRLG